MTPTDHTVEIDAELRSIVERAFPETAVDVIDADGESPPAYRSDGAEAAWKRMHDAARGREIAVLLEMLDGTWLTGEERWKAVTFLGHALRTPEALTEREKILAALAVEAIVKQRGAGAGDAVRLQGAALDAVARAPIDAGTKWEFLLEAIQGSRSYFREIVRRLGEFRPTDAETAANSYPILLDALVRGDSPADLDSVAGLVRDLDVRSATPDLRRLLLAANSHLSARVAPILAEWGDTEAVFEIRRVINQYSTANDPNVDVLFGALHALEGPSCTEYLAGVLHTAPPALQEFLIEHSLRAIPSKAIRDAIREIAETTKDAELKIVAAAYLDAAPDVSIAEERAAPTAASAAPPAASPEAVADTWQPVFENAPEPAKPTVPVPPAPAPAPAAAATPAADSWQPMTEGEHASSAAAKSDDAMARRLGVDAETLARLREDAALEAAERANQPVEGAGALEFLVRLPQLLFALAVIGALLAILFMEK